MRVHVESFGACAAGISDPDAWRAWARDPHALLETSAPDVSFLPPLHRRRCDALARSMLAACHACATDARLAEIPAVFASRHGPFDTTVGMLVDLAASRPLSPTRFSHSVHNTQLGLFSIWAQNRQPASAVSARGDTFAAGFVEALGLLQRSGSNEVLLVTGDVPVPAELAPLADEHHGGYALALVLAKQGHGTPVALRFEAAEAPSSRLAWPDALEFLRWLLGNEPSMGLQRDGHRWTWSRLAG